MNFGRKNWYDIYKKLLYLRTLGSFSFCDRSTMTYVAIMAKETPKKKIYENAGEINKKQT